ncbi:hypothetical protein TNCV_430541, partial [Trichonephila clavipes]
RISALVQRHDGHIRGQRHQEERTRTVCIRYHYTGIKHNVMALPAIEYKT